MKKYELTPKDGHKSFYKKAIVEVDENGAETLYSYGTPIIRRETNGDLTKLFTGVNEKTGEEVGYTATTGRHVKSFCGLNKAQFKAL